jgi:putative ABC transport system substrate-binding protein
MPVIGYLGSATPDAWAGRVQAFRKGLSESGFVEGRNVAIEFRWAENHYDRLQALVADLVRRNVTVIVAPGSAPAALIAKAATTAIPIVFETGADPVAAGIVPSLSRPGGNVTGVTALAFELGPKRLDLLHDAVPAAKSFAVLFNPAVGDVGDRQVRDLKIAAGKLGVELVVVAAGAESDFAAMFADLRRQGVGGLVVVPDVLTNSKSQRLGMLALRHGLPAIFQARVFADAGGLLSYGGDIAESHRMAGAYAGRVLKGERPADLPVIQASKVTLTVNLKVAKALGLTAPLSLLGRADEVIE